MPFRLSLCLSGHTKAKPHASDSHGYEKTICWGTGSAVGCMCTHWVAAFGQRPSSRFSNLQAAQLCWAACFLGAPNGSQQRCFIASVLITSRTNGQSELREYPVEIVRLSCPKCGRAFSLWSVENLGRVLMTTPRFFDRFSIKGY